jgi:hypothetical protein
MLATSVSYLSAVRIVRHKYWSQLVTRAIMLSIATGTHRQHFANRRGDSSVIKTEPCRVSHGSRQQKHDKENV